MLRNCLITGITAGAFGTVVSVAYISIFKYSALEADFSEHASITYLFGINYLIGILNCMIYFGLSKILNKENLVDFINGFILSSAVIAFSLMLMFKVDPDLKFKNENAELIKDYFFFILAPIPFFSALSWFTFKPLFLIKKKIN
jgi:hypothetical protein